MIPNIETISLDVPAGYGERIRRIADDAVREINAEIAWQKEKEEILNDDAAMLKWCNERFDFVRSGGHIGNLAVIRASSYSDWGKRNNDCMLELFPWQDRNDIRRPIIMRGSKVAMSRKYSSSKSAMGGEIIERYLRRIKFTYLYNDDIEDRFNKMDSFLRRKMRDNGWYIHDMRTYFPHPSSKENTVWFDGEFKWLKDDEYKKLILEHKSKKGEKILRELKEREAKAQWEKWQEEKAKQLRMADKARRRQHRRNLELRRIRRAEQIAAHELLSELKQNGGPNAKS